MAGLQPFVKDAPANLIYVADFSKMSKASDDQKVFYSAADTGFISENVYLFCASEGLATVVRAGIDRPALANKSNVHKHKRRSVHKRTRFNCTNVHKRTLFRPKTGFWQRA